MIKDRLIYEKLNSLADSMRMSPDIILDARNIMLQRKAILTYNYSPKKKRLLNYRAIAAFAVIICIVLISLLYINTRPYAMNTLTKSRIAITDIEDYTDKDLLYIVMPVMSAKCSVYKDNDKTMLISTDYTIVSSSGTDQVLVISDIKKRLSDYNEFKNYPVNEYQGVDIYIKEFHENGEYYTKAYFTLEGVDYYIIVMSPTENQGEEYLNNLLNSSGQND